MSSPCPGVECCNEILSYNADPDTECKYLVRVRADPEAGGSVSGGGRYAEDAIAAISETPNMDETQDVGVDLVVVVDESGTMSDAWAYIPSLLTQLDTQLRAVGIGSGTVHNRYGLVGQSFMKSADPTKYAAPTVIGGGVNYYMDPGDPWTDIDPSNPSVGMNKVVAAAGLLGIQTLPSVACEDAYAGIDCAINDRTWRTTVAKVIIFITDEDRNYPTYSAQGVLQDYYTYPDFDWSAQRTRLTAEIAAWGGTIHGAVGVTLSNGTDPVLGQNYDGTTYEADGAGGYTLGTGGMYTGETGTTSGLDGNGNAYLPSTVKQDYYDLLMGIQKSTVWNYELFRGGGLPQDSFTAALVDALAEDIVIQTSWIFDGWYDIYGNLLTTDAAWNLTVTQDVLLTARYHSMFEMT